MKAYCPRDDISLLGVKNTTAIATDQKPRIDQSVRPSVQPAASTFRPEVQALRALAVALVVTYHLWPNAVPGGFIGVDAFFVISGYLITAQLLREVARTGKVRLFSFWARRVRRLLPAALLVLLVVAFAVWAFVPEGLWQQFFSEIGGSSVYLQNWVLVSNATDYFTAHNAASPVQNFWSLSVEEQFYLIWPVLIIVPLLIPIRPSAKRILTLSILAAGTLASFIYSIHETHLDSSVSYLATTTRAWEFGVGGLLAMVSVPKWIGPNLRTALSWAGLITIVVSAMIFSGKTPFPGTAALLPAAGVLAVIAAGVPESPWGPSRLMRLRPVQSLGDMSYSLYLWHWPLIVLVPFVVAKYAPGSPGLGNVALVGILVASVALAVLSKRYVEDPARFAEFLSKHKPCRTFALMAAAMAIVVAVSGLGWNVVQLDTEASQANESALLAQHPSCLGAAAMGGVNTSVQTVAKVNSSTSSCTNSQLANVLIPTPVTAASEVPASCQIGPTDDTLKLCYAGASAASATTTVALIGDSHAAQWLPALKVVAKQNGWRIVEMLKASCAFNQAPRSSSAVAATSSCASWNAQAQQKLDAMPSVSAVFTSADIYDLYKASNGNTGFQNGVQGYESTWSQLPPTVRNVYVLKDIPRPSSDVQTCLQLLSTSARLKAGACSVPRTDAIRADPTATAAQAAGGRVSLLDLAHYFCTSTQCDPVIGHVMVYRDEDHMTSTYSTTLGPFLAASLQKAD